MRGCNDNLAGSPDFRMEVRRQADGAYVATCLSNADVPPQKGATEKEAARALEAELQTWFMTGGRAREGGR